MLTFDRLVSDVLMDLFGPGLVLAGVGGPGVEYEHHVLLPSSSLAPTAVRARCALVQAGVAGVAVVEVVSLKLRWSGGGAALPWNPRRAGIFVSDVVIVGSSSNRECHRS